VDEGFYCNFRYVLFGMRLNIQCNMNWVVMNNLVAVCSEG
jgi:hypothetical protein